MNSGKTLNDFRVDRLFSILTADTPGIYSVDERAVLAVNTGFSVNDIQGKPGVSGFTAETPDLSGKQEKELYPLFIVLCVVLLSMLIFTSRS